MNNLMKNNMMAQAKAIEKINKKIKLEKEKKQEYITNMFHHYEVSNANMLYNEGKIEKTNTEIERLIKMKEILKGSDRAAGDTAELNLERVLAEIVAAGGKITGARPLRLAPVSVGSSSSRY